MSSTVIKSGTNVRHVQGVAFQFGDVAHQANEYVAGVRAQAEVILADARRDAEQIRQRAEQEGRQAAVAAAARVLDEKVGRQMESLLPALRKAIDSISAAKPDWLRHWEHSAVHLATAIAARVIRREVERAPQISAELVREALELAVGSPRIAIRLHPEDHAALAGQVSKLSAEVARLANTEILADATVSRGGCRVETEYGVIDQTFEAQLARIEQELA
ncbi:MAG: FliH/SctL family protein [Pirellulales bacterium]